MTQVQQREIINGSSAVSASNPLPISQTTGGAVISAANPLPVAPIVAGAAVADGNPMPSGLLRKVASSSLTILINTAVSSAAIDFRQYAGGGIKSDETAWTAADITFSVAETAAGTYTPLRDAAGTLIRLTNIPAGAVFTRPLPDELFGWAYFKVNSTNTASEAAVNQAAARALIVMLKG